MGQALAGIVCSFVALLWFMTAAFKLHAGSQVCFWLCGEGLVSTLGPTLLCGGARPSGILGTRPWPLGTGGPWTRNRSLVSL